MRLTLIGLFLITFSSASLAHEKPEGGMSGGGGNVIAPKPPVGYQDPEWVKKVVFESRSILQNYLHQKELLFREGSLSSPEAEDFALLFEGRSHIQDVIKSVKLHVRDEKPCFDHQGNPVDGSVRSLNKGEICVSSFNIALKVHHEEIHPQSAALLLHEYSEAVGLSDEKAVEIQKRVLAELEK